tara:strand:- start:223 stop:1827 length:1605 start_codon:yes stop_codon:yes gene_type:complete
MAISPKPKAYYPIGDYAAFNGSEYLVNNGALSDYVFDFIPSGDYINFGKGIGNSIGDNYTGGLTISGWINPDTTSSDDGVFQFGNFTGYEMALVLNISKFIFYNNGQKFAVSYTNPNNEWTHFTLTFLPSGSVFYVNGVVAANWTYTDLDLNNLDFIIGAYYSSGYTFDGKMSNVSVFNTAIPATGSNSVETLYNNGTPLSNMSGFTSLQGWWKLDASATFDGSNWSIPDDSSNSNTGTSSGMTAANLVQSNLNITTPYSRYALNFDGTSDYINCGNDSSLQITSDLTVSTWFKILNNSGNRALVTRDTGSTQRNWSLYITGTGTLKLLLRNNTDTGWNIVESTSAFDDGVWHHAAFVYTPSTSLILYVDGIAVNTNTTSITPSINNKTADFTIGAYSPNQGYTGDRWIGKISNPSIWNASLSSAQITEIYNQGKPSNLNSHSAYSNLVSWWQLGENSSFNGTNWTVLDEKGTNNGTSANMTEADLVNGVGTTANGLSDGMGGADNIVGEAPYSTANAVSYGMGVDAKSTSVPS